MSFDVYLQSHQDGDPAGLPEATVRESFCPFLREESPDVWALEYDESNGCTVFVGRENDGTVSSLSVNRPCVDSRLWDALFRILNLGNVVFFFPGDGPPCVAHGDATAHLPPDMIDALGAPIVVSSGEELAQRIPDG